jgi:hypothetical protein
MGPLKRSVQNDTACWLEWVRLSHAWRIIKR